MLVKLCIGVMFSVLALAKAGHANCPPGVLAGQADQRLNSLATISVGNLRPWVPQLIEFEYSAVSFVATNYPCDRERVFDYPAFKGYTWIIEIPQDAVGDVVVVRQRVSEVVAQSNGRLEIIGDSVLDYDLGLEYGLEATIDFFIEHREAFELADEFRLVLSGPFWRQEDFGEVPIGLIKSRNGGLQQRYVDFLARHILCFRSEGLSLIDRGVVSNFVPVQEINGDARQRAVTAEMESRVAQECGAAIQVGPTLWEPQADGSAPQPGISGLSMREGRRNVIFSLAGPRGPRTFMISSISSVGSFDTMVLVQGLAQVIEPEGSVEWAVGMQDEQYLSGPVLVEDGTVHRLTDTDVPTGALVVLR